MHENAPILEAKSRERVGSRYARRVRKAGGLPAVVYGHKKDPLSVALDHKHAVHLIEGGDRVFRIAIDEGDPQLVLIKALQFDYLGTKVVHADFARVDLDEQVHSRVALNFAGEAKGLVAAGAMIMHPNTEVEIACAIRDLPDEIEVDMTDLDVNDTLTAGEIKLPGESMKLVSDANAVVAQVRISKGAVSAASEEEGEEGEEGAEVAEGEEGATEGEGSDESKGEKS